MRIGYEKFEHVMLMLFNLIRQYHISKGMIQTFFSLFLSSHLRSFINSNVWTFQTFTFIVIKEGVFFLLKLCLHNSVNRLDFCLKRYLVIRTYCRHKLVLLDILVHSWLWFDTNWECNGSYIFTRVFFSDSFRIYIIVESDTRFFAIRNLYHKDFFHLN